MNQPIVYADITQLAKDLSDISGKSPEEITRNIYEDVGQKITAEAKSLAPVDTGRLRNSINYRITGNQLIVGPDVPYAPYQEFGTGTRGEFRGNMYTIRPKNGRYLRFKGSNGNWVTAKVVYHPGIPPHPFMRPASEHVIGSIVDKLAERGESLIVKGPNA